MTKRKIVLTGGHAASTALAIVEELMRRRGKWEVYWIGSKDLGKQGVDSRKIIAGKFHKKWSFYTIVSLAKIPLGFFGAFYHLVKIRPAVILSFGGFAALPVVVVGWIFGIPSILHEQTVVSGLANRLSTPFAKKIAVARKQSLGLYPKQKTILVGNPQMASMFKIGAKDNIGTTPVIFVTGGSSGSQILNKVIRDSLGELLEKYYVIHQTGKLDFEKFRDLRKSLPGPLKGKYEVFSYVNPEEIPYVFARTDMVISRGGANTVADIITTRRPAIIIPIPWSIGDEQRKNARTAQEVGVAVVLEQGELSKESLLRKINFLEANWERMVLTSDNALYKLDVEASKRLVDLVEKGIK